MGIYPKAANFHDLFAGGCAITQVALMKSEYRNYFCNDIDFDGILLFMDAIHGKFKNESRWISREDFIVLKNKEPYIKYCWSFGNNGRDYLYSKEVEPWKKALHYARVLNDFSLLEAFGIKIDKADRITIAKNADEWKKKYIEWAIKFFAFTDEEIEKYNQYKKEGVFENLIHGSVGLVQLKKRLRSLESLQSLERLQSLQSLQRLSVSNKSYDEVEILPNSVLYCDIPYYDTDEYSEGGFDHQKFYKWALRQKELVVISEYYMPDDFVCIDAIGKSVTLNSGASKKAIEKLFIPKHQRELYNNLMKRR